MNSLRLPRPGDARAEFPASKHPGKHWKVFRVRTLIKASSWVHEALIQKGAEVEEDDSSTPLESVATLRLGNEEREKKERKC